MGGTIGMLAACTSPTFEPFDAGDVEVGGSDAAGPPVSAQCASWPEDSALPSGAMGLVGRYAARFDTFGYDDIATIRAREHQQRIYAVEIVARAGQLEMALRTCDWQSSYQSLGTLLTASSRPLELASLPMRSLQMSFGPGCSWSARPSAPLLWGYAATSPAACTPGGSIARAPEQGWLGDSCSCARSDQLPSDDQDCRVADPDRDGKPGVTIDWQNEELGHEVYHVAMRDESELLEGAIDAADVLTAHELRKLLVAHLGGDFPRVPSACPDSTSRVTIKRLPSTEPGVDTCADARRTFWAEAELPFPERECLDQ